MLNELTAPPSTPIGNVHFTNACLTTSEARVLLEARTKAYKTDMSGGIKHEQPAAQRKAAEYCEEFARYRTPEANKQMRTALESAGLEPGEIAMMGSLCPSNPDEAISLIPSLERFEYSKISKMISDLWQHTDKKLTSNVASSP